MKITAEARAVRKKAQLERLERKGEEDYPEFYAKQPQQVARAELNDKIRQARVLQRQASRDLDLAIASGINIEIAEAAIRDAATARAGLELLKTTRFRPATTAALGSAS